MSQSDIKSLQTLMERLDAADIISIMERLHAAAVSGQFNMSALTDPETKRPDLEPVIDWLEGLESRVGVVKGFLKGLNGVPFDITTPPSSDTHGSDARQSHAPAQAKAPSHTTPASFIRHQYYQCPTCEMWAKPGVSHRCSEDEGRAGDCFNGFFAEELDIIHGPEGWEKIDPPTGLQVSEPEKTSAEEVDAEDDLERLGLRPNSKLHRVYMIAKELLAKNDSFHIDAIIEPMAKAQMFIGVQNRRANAANFLSKLKARNLLDSDNRGFWFLPRKKAAK